MPVPSSFNDLDTVANNNSPPGTESAKGNVDNYIRQAYAFIKQNYNFMTTLLGTDSSNKAAARETLGVYQAGIQDFRLTLTTGTPVTTSDVTGASTIYAAPYKGNRIALYDGSKWNVRTSTEFSLALSALTSGRPYDVFCYDNSGTPTLEFLAWSSDTTRATELARQDGVLVKSGAATRRYLGTFYTTGTTTTEDSATKRYLWNYYNRVSSLMERSETTATWTYSTATWRQANGSTSNQVNYVVGVAEDVFSANVTGHSTNTNGIGTAVAIGSDSTSTPAGQFSNIQSSAGGEIQAGAGAAQLVPAAGRHYFAWLEWSRALGTTTWYGSDFGGTSYQVRSQLQARGTR